MPQTTHLWNRPRDVWIVQVLYLQENPVCGSRRRGIRRGGRYLWGTRGSVLGPIFFLIYINNMAEYTKHSSVDCLQMTPSYTSPLLQKTTAKKLQEDLQTLEKWEADWLMTFHPDKCSVIRITRKKTIHRYPYTLHG